MCMMIKKMTITNVNVFSIMATPLVIEKYSHPIVLLTVSDKLIMK